MQLFKACFDQNGRSALNRGAQVAHEGVAGGLSGTAHGGLRATSKKGRQPERGLRRVGLQFHRKFGMTSPSKHRIGNYCTNASTH
jgi:hypothetical protein